MAEPSIKDIAYRTAASVFGGPVDLATMVMRPFGYKTPDEQIFGSSEYIGKKLEDVGLVSSARAPLTEFIASVAVPTPGGIAKGAAMAAPAIGGMLIGKGGKLSSSLEDAMLAAEKIKSLGPEFIPKIEQASGGSVYLTVAKQQFTKSGEPSKKVKPIPVDFKARFADHPSYWGSSISSDPVTGNDVDTVVKMFESKIGRAPEPNFTTARFNPADKYGTVEDVRFFEGLSHRGNPVMKRTVESRPFTFYEPKTAWDAQAAQSAKTLEDIGIDPTTIWKQTGTWKGSDGKWRQQIQPIGNQSKIE